jgi:hypothetical protein
VTRLALAALLLAACPSSWPHAAAIPALASTQGSRLNTSQTCLPAPELLACAERQALAILGRAVELGHASSLASALSRWGHPRVCLVEEQEPCCLGDLCASSSTPERAKLPRAACTVYNATWLARRSEEGLPYDYSGTLWAELLTSTGAALGLPIRADHSSSWDRLPYPGGAAACEWRR